MYNPKPIKLRVMKNYEASAAQDQWFHSQYWKKITNPPHYFVCMPDHIHHHNLLLRVDYKYDDIVVHCHYETPAPTSGEDLPLKRSVHCSYRSGFSNVEPYRSLSRTRIDIGVRKCRILVII